MVAEGRFRRIRGALGNAVVFAVGWSIAAFVLWLPLRQAQLVPQISFLSGAGIAIRFGLMGFITGAAFPTLMRLVYGRKHLSEISWVRFGIAGGIVTGLFVPTFMQSMNVLSGDGMVPFALIRLDILWTAVLGALVASISIKLAQYAEKLFPETFQYHLDRLERITRLTAGERDIPVVQRPRPAEVAEPTSAKHAAR